MKKILLIFNGTEAPPHVISSAVGIARTDNTLLHAIFLEAAAYRPTLDYPFISDLSLAEATIPGPSIEQENETLTNHNIQLFRDACTAANVSFSISFRREISLDELIRHSAFADLIVVDAKAHIPENPSMPLTVSLSDLLADAHCPVLLLQQELQQPDQVILSYDGSFSCMHALKMYSYLFPEWRSIPICLLSISPKGDAPLAYKEYITDWLPLHFSQTKIELLTGPVKKDLVEIVKNSGQNTLVVMGAYGRTAISRLFRKSLSNNIIHDTKAALFIAHEPVHT